MNEPPLEKLNLLDTQYADILANSSHPAFELQLVQLGVDITEARTKTKLITLIQRQPETLEEWEELINAWEAACGYRPSYEHFSVISQLLWENNTEEE